MKTIDRELLHREIFKFLKEKPIWVDAERLFEFSLGEEHKVKVVYLSDVYNLVHHIVEKTFKIKIIN